MRAGDEGEYLNQSSKAIELVLSASPVELEEDAGIEAAPELAARVVENGAAQYRKFPPWVHALAPRHFASGTSRVLLLGPRPGGRTHLREDIRALERLTAIVCEHVERTRASEMQHLVSQAELRVLQAQINPHFLFNSLNTLYGSIERDNTVARGLVNNLASLFRYALTSERSFIRLEQEMRIVRAYLDIEQLRLGPKLNAVIDVDQDVLETDIPVFSIQPLVENAVKHGVAAHQGTGFVTVVVRRAGEGVSVEVANSGPFRKPARDSEQGGIGLANVRKRLALCYGSAGEVKIDSAFDRTKISFTVPAARVSNVSAGVSA
jgi:two-component system, LytTR family, sensor kinase